MVCDSERIQLCNNEIDEFRLKLKFFSFQPPNVSDANSQFENSQYSIGNWQFNNNEQSRTKDHLFNQ